MELSNKPGRTRPRDTILRVNARPGWQQRTMEPFNSPAMLAHMEALAWNVFKQLDSWHEVTVYAQCGGKSRVLTFSRQIRRI